MTEKEFLDLLFERYTQEVSEDIPDDLGFYLGYYLDNYPSEKLGLLISRKTAARIIHEFMVNVLKWKDVDWKDAAKLKDIYDCRVCSNAIAQVYVRGIIGEAAPGVFDLDKTFTTQEGTEIIGRLLAMTKSHGNEQSRK
ncbi:hypothetical protein [Butyrivibrio sp. VCB2006]|uniref:hypothetical protein n=1 Tax=Butyrivibrio sp. VCB2006 TaxID=1280679 RepID=UPI00040AC60F|nr:hypothetical protein [Butyrivibrio sp. VCB2006]